MLNVQTGRPSVFPFVAIVGQEQMKLALTLIAVYPAIGGLLIRGQKGTAKSTAVRGLFKHQGQKVVDVVISVMGMSMTIAAPEYEQVLPCLDVPYLQGLVSSSPDAVWKESAQGVSTMDVTFQAAQPEFDGALITVPVATREEDAVDPVTGGMIARNVPIAERTQKLVSLALNWARLSRIPNAKKRVAIGWPRRTRSIPRCRSG